MDQPVTELDERFSDPEADPTEWQAAREVLAGAQISWVTTVRADGRPHLTPLVAVWLDEMLHFCTGPEEQKAMNLRGNPNVVLMTGCNRWDEGLDVVVEGEARRVTDDAVLERLAAAWATKWDGSWRFEVRDGMFHHEAGEALVFAVAPRRVFSFARGTFSQTRHRL